MLMTVEQVFSNHDHESQLAWSAAGNSTRRFCLVSRGERRVVPSKNSGATIGKTIKTKPEIMGIGDL